jgi:hypothetical protein
VVDTSSLYRTVTEEYNGTTWTNVKVCQQQELFTGAGVQTAALAFGGTRPLDVTGATEEYEWFFLDKW